MEDENHKNYLDERRELDGNNSPDINSENEIKSEPKKELLGSSSGAGALKNNSNEVLDAMKKKKRKDQLSSLMRKNIYLQQDLLFLALLAHLYYLI